MPDLDSVYQELHRILRPYGKKLDVKRDDDSELYIDTHYIQKNKKPLFFGAVQKKKAYVSFHLMPVYVKPELIASISSELSARMQGKSCFNFKASDPALFRELAALTKQAYASYEEQGFA